MLDIGTGSGVIPLLCAINFQPRLVVGIDIDPKNTKIAIKTMQTAINDRESFLLLKDTMEKGEDEIMATDKLQKK